MIKVVLLNGAGIDTLATLVLLSKQKAVKYEFHSLYVYAGQKNGDRAKAAAEKIAGKYCESHRVIDIGDWVIPHKNLHFVILVM